MFGKVFKTIRLYPLILLTLFLTACGPAKNGCSSEWNLSTRAGSGVSYAIKALVVDNITDTLIGNQLRKNSNGGQESISKEYRLVDENGVSNIEEGDSKYGILQRMMVNVFSNSFFKAVLYLSLILFVSTRGIAFAMGSAQMTTDTIIKSFLKAGVIAYLFTPAGLNAYYNYIVIPVLQTGNEFMATLMDLSRTALIETTNNGGGLVGSDGTSWNPGSDKHDPWSDFMKLGVMGPFALIMDSLLDITMLLKIVGLLFLGVTGPIILILAFSAVAILALALIKILIVYLGLYFVMTAVFSIGNILIILLLFKITNDVGKKFIKTIWGTWLQFHMIALMVFVVGIMGYVFYQAAFGYQACVGNIFSVKITIPVPKIITDIIDFLMDIIKSVTFGSVPDIGFPRYIVNTDIPLISFFIAAIQGAFESPFEATMDKMSSVAALFLFAYMMISLPDAIIKMGASFAGSSLDATAATGSALKALSGFQQKIADKAKSAVQDHLKAGLQGKNHKFALERMADIAGTVGAKGVQKKLNKAANTSAFSKMPGGKSKLANLYNAGLDDKFNVDRHNAKAIEKEAYKMMKDDPNLTAQQARTNATQKLLKEGKLQTVSDKNGKSVVEKATKDNLGAGGIEKLQQDAQNVTAKKDSQDKLGLIKGAIGVQSEDEKSAQGKLDDASDNTMSSTGGFKNAGNALMSAPGEFKQGAENLAGSITGNRTDKQAQDIALHQDSNINYQESQQDYKDAMNGQEGMRSLEKNLADTLKKNGVEYSDANKYAKDAMSKVNAQNPGQSFQDRAALLEQGLKNDIASGNVPELDSIDKNNADAFGGDLKAMNDNTENAYNFLSEETHELSQGNKEKVNNRKNDKNIAGRALQSIKSGGQSIKQTFTPSNQWLRQRGSKKPKK